MFVTLIRRRKKKHTNNKGAKTPENSRDSFHTRLKSLLKRFFLVFLSLWISCLRAPACVCVCVWRRSQLGVEGTDCRTKRALLCSLIALTRQSLIHLSGPRTRTFRRVSAPQYKQETGNTQKTLFGFHPDTRTNLSQRDSDRAPELTLHLVPDSDGCTWKKNNSAFIYITWILFNIHI